MSFLFQDNTDPNNTFDILLKDPFKYKQFHFIIHIFVPFFFVYTFAFSKKLNNSTRPPLLLDSL